MYVGGGGGGVEWRGGGRGRRFGKRRDRERERSQNDLKVREGNENWTVSDMHRCIQIVM